MRTVLVKLSSEINFKSISLFGTSISTWFLLALVSWLVLGSWLALGSWWLASGSWLVFGCQQDLRSWLVLGNWLVLRSWLALRISRISFLKKLFNLTDVQGFHLHLLVGCFTHISLLIIFWLLETKLRHRSYLSVFQELLDQCLDVRICIRNKISQISPEFLRVVSLHKTLRIDHVIVSLEFSLVISNLENTKSATNGLVLGFIIYLINRPKIVDLILAQVCVAELM